MLAQYQMTSLLHPPTIYAKASDESRVANKVYEKLSDDTALFAAVKSELEKAKKAGRAADAEMLGQRLANSDYLATGCAGVWKQALYVRKLRPYP